MIPSPPTAELASTKKEIMLMLPPLRAEAHVLMVKTEGDYQKADGLLTRILTSKRWWLNGSTEPNSKWRGIDAIIKPFREGLDGLYELKNEGLKPLEEMESAVKVKMRAFKVAEGQRLAEEKRQQQVAAAKIQREIHEKQERENAAKTVKMRERLISERMELESKQKEVQKTTLAPVKAARSSARTVKKPVIVDFAVFAAGILALSQGEGGVPLDLITADLTRLARLYKDDPALVAQLPGVEIQDDVVIAGR